MITSCWAESSVGFIAVENVLLSADCRDTFLCDFGLSETVDDNGRSNQAFRGKLSLYRARNYGNFQTNKEYVCAFLIKCIYVVNYLCEPSRQK